MKRILGYFSCFTSLAFVLSGCGSTSTFITPREWSSTAMVDTIIASYRPALEGRRIFLDPGHGGQDRVNRGPKGDAIEADVNLRVALRLRNYLTRAGAIVFISRDHDTTITLQDRPMLAVAAGAEIFVSLHHNATGGSDANTNYSSTYYHAREGDPDYHPSDHDLAKFVQRDMSYAMRNPNPWFSPTFDGTLSDYDIYPNSGFAVLRRNPLPAILIEGSFFSHPPEEQRLAQEEFNNIEAWGIFLGLGKYFRTGIPKLELLSDTIQTVPRPSLAVKYIPVSSIDPHSIHVAIDGKEEAFAASDSTRTIMLTPEKALSSGTHALTVDLRDRSGNSSWPFRRNITIMLPPAELRLSVHPAQLPPMTGAFARVVCRAKDNQGVPVADGTVIHMRIPGERIDSTLTTKDGQVAMYVAPAQHGEIISIEASSDPLVQMAGISLKESAARFLSGVIRTDTIPLPHAVMEILSNDSSETVLDTSWLDGRYIGMVPADGFVVLRASRPGYFARRVSLQIGNRANMQDIMMSPVAAGKLHRRTFLLDPRFGGTENGVTRPDGLRSSDINLRVARLLSELLTAAGANAVLVRTDDRTFSEAARSSFSARYARGRYLRIDAATEGNVAAAEVFPSQSNAAFAASLLSGLRTVAGLDSGLTTNSRSEFYRDVALATVTIQLPSARSSFYSSDIDNQVESLAWGLFTGILHSEGALLTNTEKFTVLNEAGMPVPHARVWLDDTFSRLSDSSGHVDFCGVDNPGAVLRAPQVHNGSIIREHHQ